MTTHKSAAHLHCGYMVTPIMAQDNLIHAIKSEPMLFRADPHFAEVHGDVLTLEFLAAAEQIWGSLDGCIIDSRHHMLMPGMYPCIPGWHTDDAPRSKAYCDGQPDIFTPEYVTEHLMCVVDAGTGSLTEFMEGDVWLPQGTIESAYRHKGNTFYKTCDYLIEQGVVGGNCNHFSPRSGDIVEFDANSWHRGQPAKSRGFRFFIRITRKSRHAVQNEIRSNAQVYITDSSYGW